MEGNSLKNKDVWVEGIKKALPRDIPLILLYFFLILILGYSSDIQNNFLKVGVIILIVLTAYLAYKRRMEHENKRLEKGVKNGN